MNTLAINEWTAHEPACKGPSEIILNQKTGFQWWTVLTFLNFGCCLSKSDTLFHHTYFHDCKWDCERGWMEMRQVQKDGLLVAACVTTVFKLQN